MSESVITYFSTSEGNYVFDAYFNITHESNLNITKHPVQTGADVGDHAFMEAKTLTFEIGMSDVMQDIYIGANQFSSGSSGSRSVNAYEVLKRLQSNRIPIEAITRLGTYKNMLIASIIVPDDKTTTYGLKATVTLEELLVANVTTVKISERPQKSETSNEGDQKPQQVDESMASAILNSH